MTKELSPRFRILSGVEFVLGAFIVIGHNVLRILPNEVPILCVIGLISLRLRDGGWTRMGLKRPNSWARIFLIAAAAAALRIVLGDLVIEPLTARFWPPIAAPEGAKSITGDFKAALIGLLLVWSFAAFGEEVAYRGYLLNRAADVGGQNTAAYWNCVLLVSILFGFGHFYKGPAGILDSAVAGLILGAAYIISGRNLWTAVLAHGVMDTVGLAILYFGWQS
jgi:membrane protease YdiL (CAAX protease family)